MRKEKTIFFLGIWLVIAPLLGFPDLIRKILIILTGIAIAIVGYFLYKEKKFAHKSLISELQEITE